jgi:hypothetical protein
MSSDLLNILEDLGRHNLVVVRCDANSLNNTIERLNEAGVNSVNVGKELSEKLTAVESTRFLTIESQEYLHEMIDNQTREIVPGKLKVVAIYNIGILLDPALSLNAANLLKEISKYVAIIILWDHISSEGLLHWGIQQEQYYLNLSDIYIAGRSAEYEI